MFIKHWLALLVIALLGGCASYKGLYYDPATDRAHGPKVDPGATVRIGTLFGAEIRKVNGRSVIIGGDYKVRGPYGPHATSHALALLREKQHDRQEYEVLRGRPGRYELEVGTYSYEIKESGLGEDWRAQGYLQKSDEVYRLTPFEAAPGNYWAHIVREESTENWTAIVLGPDDRIVAAAVPGLVGVRMSELRSALKARAEKKRKSDR